MYKLIATDMDGTLLYKNKISKENEVAIIKAQKQGVKCVLASGRPKAAMLDYAKQLKLDEYESYIISYNGAEIIDYKANKSIFAKSLSKDQIKAIFEISKLYDVAVLTYIDDVIFTNKMNKYSELEIGYTSMPYTIYESIEEIIDSKMMKFMFVAESGVIKKISEETKEKFKNFGLATAISDPHFLEIVDIDVNKGYALKKLCEILNIDIKETIACGDSYNDIPMLEIAGLSVAAGNSNEVIKSICDYTSVDCSENVLDNVIKKYIIKE